MDKDTMIRISKEEEKRFKALKKACDTCVPDELIEWITYVVAIVNEVDYDYQN